MDVPGIVRERLDDERRMTSVNAGGDDRVYVTPPRTLVYHASGLFSRESIDEYSHDARRFDVSADRREATFAFEYDDGVEAFSVPSERIDTVLPPVLAGVLRTTGLIDADESVEESYRFGERTLVVTDRRLLTSIGEAVWERDHESYAYEDVTDLGFEDGHLVVEVDGQPQRIELAGDGRREAYETVETAVCAYHDVDSVEELPGTTEQGREPAEETASAWGPPQTPDPTPDSTPDPTPDTTSDIENAEPEPETEPHVASSPPPSSPAPGDPSTDSVIPEAPDSGRFEAGDTAPDEPMAANEHPDTPGSGDGVATDTDTGDTHGPTVGTEPDDTDLASELDALRERVERQNRLLERNHELLEQLVENPQTERVTDDR